eukprot:scaffold17449_cov112-Isochrysis_galbana.AAC.1
MHPPPLSHHQLPASRGPACCTLVAFCCSPWPCHIYPATVHTRLPTSRRLPLIISHPSRGPPRADREEPQLGLVSEERTAHAQHAIACSDPIGGRTSVPCT